MGAVWYPKPDASSHAWKPTPRDESGLYGSIGLRLIPEMVYVAVVD